MDKKIVFFDIDETMVNVPEGMLEPSLETCRVIKEFQAQGNYVVVATARVTAPESIKKIAFDGYIFCDGHYIEVDKKVFIDNLFPTATLKKLIDIFKKYNAQYFMNGCHGHWISDLNHPLTLRHYYKYNGKVDWPEGTPKTWRVEDVKANVVTAIFDNGKDMFACKEELPKEWEITAYDDPASIRMDIHLPGFTKGSACEYVVEKVGVNKENAYAFGDGINDIEMIQSIKYGIAMGNAKEEVKAVAYDVTDTVSNDGIAKAFKKYFNI